VVRSLRLYHVLLAHSNLGVDMTNMVHRYLLEQSWRTGGSLDLAVRHALHTIFTYPSQPDRVDGAYISNERGARPRIRHPSISRLAHYHWLTAKEHTSQSQESFDCRTWVFFNSETGKLIQFGPGHRCFTMLVDVKAPHLIHHCFPP
jgi:hypothetical protein